MKIIISLIFISSLLFSYEVSDFIDTSKCDKIINKKYYNICYSYKYRAPLSGWAILKDEEVNKITKFKRPRFYTEKTIPKKYRIKYSDYTGYGKLWNRGHFIVADADLDFSKKSLLKAYTMANIVPMSAKVNQKTFVKAESLGRRLAKKYGKVTSISIAKYSNKKIKNKVYIPYEFYRIYIYNKKAICLRYKNELNINTKNDTLTSHYIKCDSIAIKNK